MKDTNAIVLNGIVYELVPDTDKEKEIFKETASEGNCHNYCDLAHVCKLAANTYGCILCHDIFLKHNVHFKTTSVWA